MHFENVILRCIFIGWNSNRKFSSIFSLSSDRSLELCPNEIRGYGLFDFLSVTSNVNVEFAISSVVGAKQTILRKTKMIDSVSSTRKFCDSSLSVEGQEKLNQHIEFYFLFNFRPIRTSEQEKVSIRINQSSTWENKLKEFVENFHFRPWERRSWLTQRKRIVSIYFSFVS